MFWLQIKHGPPIEEHRVPLHEDPQAAKDGAFLFNLVAEPATTVPKTANRTVSIGVKDLRKILINVSPFLKVVSQRRFRNHRTVLGFRLAHETLIARAEPATAYRLAGIQVRTS